VRIAELCKRTVAPQAVVHTQLAAWHARQPPPHQVMLLVLRRVRPGSFGIASSQPGTCIALPLRCCPSGLSAGAAARGPASRMAAVASITTATDSTTSTVSEAAAPRRIRVYTRTGDKGTSSLYNGQRAPKDDAVFSALGDVDELNASIGLAREHCARTQPAGGASGTTGVGIEEQLAEIQSRLLDMGTAVATPLDSSSAAALERARFDGVAHAAALEAWIDAMDDALPPLKNFILPVRAWTRGEGLPWVALHLLRVCP
jgi:ATP:cob(I)alamin adenosyltransferase